jgi:hypothetical protein
MEKLRYDISCVCVWYWGVCILLNEKREKETILEEVEASHSSDYIFYEGKVLSAKPLYIIIPCSWVY